MNKFKETEREGWETMFFDLPKSMGYVIRDYSGQQDITIGQAIRTLLNAGISVTRITPSVPIRVDQEPDSSTFRNKHQE